MELQEKVTGNPEYFSNRSNKECIFNCNKRFK